MQAASVLQGLIGSVVVPLIGKNAGALVVYFVACPAPSTKVEVKVGYLKFNRYLRLA